MFLAIHLVVSALLNTAGWGQSSNYAPVDYNFQKEPFPFTGSVLGHTFAASDNAYYEPNLSCLAANGYGQWTAGTGPGVNIGQTTNFNNPQWFLLSNMLCDGDITIPNKVRPKGIVASGSFLNPRPTKEHSITGVVIKVCTNLQGRVRYVWPNWDTSTGKYEGFVIQGFNDSRWGAVELSSSQQIDIGLASMNETPVQNPETRKIVVKPIFNYVRVGAAEQFLKVPNMNLKIGVPTGSPDDPVYEFDWRDVYDIAMDTKFLYIVWEDVTDDGNGIYSWNVKGVAIDLATGEVARWYDGGTHPKPSNPTINEPTSGKIMLNGMIRPTVACDVRNNPTDPTFDVAAIKVNQAVDPSDQHRVVAHIGVEHREVSSGSITPRVVPLDELIPNPQSLWAFDANLGRSRTVTQGYQTPDHARILVSSTQVQSTPVKALYILRHEGTPVSGINGEALLFHKFNNTTHSWENSAHYVHGQLSYPFGINSSSLRMAPLPSPFNVPYVSGVSNPLGPNVMDEHIVAFANPYDGEANQSFSEFHCVFKLIFPEQKIPTTEVEYHYPILIVRSDNNGIFPDDANHQTVPPDTRTPINRTSTNNGSSWQELEDIKPTTGTSGHPPGILLGSANEMGLHIHWTPKMVLTGAFNDLGSHFYTRDMRAFDENIEENTLVTHECQIKDGQSHGGTNSIVLQSGRMMTIWTDPFRVFGGSPQEVSLYTAPDNTLSWFNGRLKFKDDNVSLSIGPANATLGNGASLVVMPNFEMWMGNVTGTPTNPSFNNTNSVHKLSISPYSTFEYYGIPPAAITPFGNYKSNFIGTGTIQLLSNSQLNLHGGSDFRLPDYFILDAHGGVGPPPDLHLICIRSLFEPSIFPLPTGSTQNLRDVGMLSISGDAGIYDGVISVIIPGSYSTAPTLVKPVININSPLYSGTGLSSDQFTVSATLFGGDDLCPASLSCQNQGNTLYRNCIIDQCTFTDFSIFASNPQNDWTVTGSTFYKPFSKAIELQWGIADINSHPYGAISITGNTINCIPSLNNQLFSGIHVEGFSKPRSNSSNPFDKILIEGNEIEAAPNSTSTAESSVSGIKLINTSAKVSGNAVHGGRNPFYNNTVGNGFQYGIYNEGAPDGTTPSNSLLCNNTIISCAAPSSTGAGINTQRWNGVAQLNDVSGSNIGHQSNVNDDGRILWSRYHSNSLCGLKLAAASSHMDLSGYHISASSTDLPALNTIDGNNLTHSTTSGQIVLTGNQFFWLGTDNTTSITNFGNNNIISLESDDILDPLIYNPTGTPTTGINKNFWGHDDGTSINSWTLKSTPELIVGINYANGSFQNGSSYALGTVGCTDGLEEHNDNQIIRPKDAAFDEGNISVADCAHLYNVGKDYSGSSKPINLRKGYDTLRSFIESCAAIPNSADGKPSWGAFISLDKCVNEMDTANIRWLEYREWLKKVLYLSDDSMYYCSDVNSLFTTFNYLVPSKGWDYNSIIAVIDYLLTSNRCPDQTAYFLEGRQYDRDRQVQFWRDTVKDSIATPLDTSAISIDSIGLSILKGPQFGAVKNHPFQSIALSELRASKNPFTDETTLETTISDAMMLRLEVFDVLGKQVYSENEFFSSGDVRWKLDGKLLPKGSLYARVSTIGGNVRTVKLVRE